MKKLIFLAIASLFLFSVNQAQTHKINGRVTDMDGDFLPGVNVTVKGTTLGTVTDINGLFELAVSDTSLVLQFSFLGYETAEFEWDKGMFAEIALLEAKVEIDEVVVTGYGAEKRSSFTGAISGTVSGVFIPSARKSKPGKESFKMVETSYSYDEISLDAPSSMGAAASVGPGMLTAGEVNDFTKWELWNDIAEDQLKQWRDYWKINASERYTVQVVSAYQTPVVDCRVNLKNKSGETIWASRTDNTGKAEFWANIFGKGADKAEEFYIEAVFEGKVYSKNKITKFHDGVNILEIPVNCNIPDKADIVFVVDATGSMGDEINYLKAELNDVIQKTKDTLPNLDIQLGSVFYRDKGDSYLTKKSGLSPDISQTVEFIKQQGAAGGGDTPEAVDEALHVAITNMAWREYATARLLFLVLDAPPHHNDSTVERLQELTRLASSKGIRIIPITCSGIDKSTEYLTRAMALATNGTYLFLTDHSGIGNPHIEPTTDEYQVNKFNNLLVQIIYQFSYSIACNQDLTLLKESDQDTLVVENPDYKTTELADSSATDLDLENPDSLVSEENPEQENENPEIAEKIKSWKYYPNPVRDILTIEPIGNSGYIYVADISGKIIQRHEVYENQTIYADLSHFPNGVYFIKYEYQPDSWVSGKIILIH